MVRIRLKRTGAKNWISFRIVATEMRTARDGKVLEELGYYDPRRSDEKIDVVATEGWVAKGAQMSPTVADILQRAKDGKSKARGVADAFTKKKNFKKGAAAEGAAAEAKA